MLHKAVFNYIGTKVYCKLMQRDAEENQQLFQVNCTGGLVVEVLYDSDQVGVNVGEPHSRTSQLTLSNAI